MKNIKSVKMLKAIMLKTTIFYHTYLQSILYNNMSIVDIACKFSNKIANILLTGISHD